MTLGRLLALAYLLHSHFTPALSIDQQLLRESYSEVNETMILHDISADQIPADVFQNYSCVKVTNGNANVCLSHQ